MKRFVAAAMLSFTFASVASVAHAAPARADIEAVVGRTVRPLMQKNGIAGMAVGVIVDGKPYVFDYGVASKETGQPVSRDTLFELGSVSKTFTATLTSYAQEQGALKLSDPVARFLPMLAGSPFGDDVTLLNLGTHTPGGLPLQVPDEITSDAQLMDWLRAWQPAHAPGTFRTYSNPGIGTLGLIAANSMKRDFTALMREQVFPSLGLKNSFLDVPASRRKDYAQGYTKDGQPIRMKGGELAAEAYGVRATAADMTRFVQANMGDASGIGAPWQRAIDATHTSYFQAGPLTQDLIWEQYPYPVALDALQQGNAPSMIVDGMNVTPIDPPQPPNAATWINKTGTTNGFGTYVAFVPKLHLGIVLLANRNYPNGERVAAGYAILSALAHEK
jgi:beta-lactamase class C